LSSFVYADLDFPESTDDDVVFPFDNVVVGETLEWQSVVDFSGFVKDDIIDTDQQASYFDDFLTFLRIQWFTAFEKWWQIYTEDKSWVAYVINLVNLWLQLAAMLATLFLIYWFISMFFASDEDGFTKAKKIVVNVAISLAVLGLSFFLVNMLFYFYSRVESVEDWPNTSDFTVWALPHSQDIASPLI